MTWALGFFLVIGVVFLLLMGLSLSRVARQGDDEVKANLKNLDSGVLKFLSDIKRRKTEK